jgi:putative ubiquitin-RnfH superfamily antitoxin RatB of RatAB toxin-antitoxin module
MVKDKEMAEMITVEVAYALASRQDILTLQVPVGTTALQAVHESSITELYPEINPNTAPMGIFSRRLDGKTLQEPADYKLREKDRVEIYRSLLLDPKEARIARAARAAKERREK